MSEHERRLETALRKSAEREAKLLVVMQAAWIEWRRGGGADAAMGWIENTLSGPGLLPAPDEPCAGNAQDFFDLHRPDAFPPCSVCGAPGYSMGATDSLCRKHDAALSGKAER